MKLFFIMTELINNSKACSSSVLHIVERGRKETCFFLCLLYILMLQIYLDEHSFLGKPLKLILIQQY